MTIKRASLYLAMLYLGVFLYSEILSWIKPSLEPISVMGFLMVDKILLAVALLALVFGLNIHRQCGLEFKANWRTLPLYWPMALFAVMTIATGVNTDTSASMLGIILLTVIAVGVNEELMFRGMVYYWFRNLSLRKRIFISGVSFGGLHFLGLFSSIDSGIILAQIYMAAGVGLIFAYARSQDYSIMVPILVHAVFNFLTLGSKGGVVEAASTGEPQQVIGGLLLVGTIAWLWGSYLLWKGNFNSSQNGKGLVAETAMQGNGQ